MSSQIVSTKLRTIAEQAVLYPERVFTTLAHHIDVEFLEEAFRRTRKNGAPGVDKVTAVEYAGNLEGNLQDLYQRLRSGKYKAPPVKRVWLEKEDGSQRPIGIPALEDKIVQRAVAMLMGAIYEQDFYDVSYGFREKCSAHQALGTIRSQCGRQNINWIVDADVSKFFDSIEHAQLREFIKKRVNDGALLRLIGKWLNAGVVDGECLTYSETGTPQGGVISPLLANIVLHYVLDEWFIKEITPLLKGRSFLVRYADDFVIGCECEQDARRIMEVLPKRFDRFGLTIHPKKTKLIPFGKPGRKSETVEETGTFDFLGFTHYWAKAREGYWVIKRKTMKKRLRRTMKSLWVWCQVNRHMSVADQHRKLCQKLQGHYQYYGIRCNFRSMALVYRYVRAAWRFWLSRRHRKGVIPWDRFERLLKAYPLKVPKICHAI